MPKAFKNEHYVSIAQGDGAYDNVEVTSTKDAEQIISVLRAWIDGDNDEDDEPLSQCPCGKVPAKLDIIDSGEGGKYANVFGSDCCGEWMINFRTGYHRLETPECMALATEAWNAAPRMSYTLSN